MAYDPAKEQSAGSFSWDDIFGPGSDDAFTSTNPGNQSTLDAETLLRMARAWQERFSSDLFEDMVFGADGASSYRYKGADDCPPVPEGFIDVRVDLDAYRREPPATRQRFIDHMIYFAQGRGFTLQKEFAYGRKQIYRFAKA